MGVFWSWPLVILSHPLATMAFVAPLIGLVLTVAMLCIATPGLRRFVLHMFVFCVCTLPLRIGHRDITVELLRGWVEDTLCGLPIVIAFPTAIQYAVHAMSEKPVKTD